MESKCYSIIPAAGKSKRMGCQKLLLPWPSENDNESTVLHSVLKAWHTSIVNETVVVIRNEDRETPDSKKIISICKEYRVHLLYACDPTDMKASIRSGIRFLIDKFEPNGSDKCFVSPADLPNLQSHVIDSMAAQDLKDSQSCVPLFGGKRGHPALLNWNLLNTIFELEDDQGVNSIVNRSNQIELEFSAKDLVTDIDTKVEYEELKNRYLS